MDTNFSKAIKQKIPGLSTKHSRAVRQGLNNQKYTLNSKALDNLTAQKYWKAKCLSYLITVFNQSGLSSLCKKSRFIRSPASQHFCIWHFPFQRQWDPVPTVFSWHKAWTKSYMQTKARTASLERGRWDPGRRTAKVESTWTRELTQVHCRVEHRNATGAKQNRSQLADMLL